MTTRDDGPNAEQVRYWNETVGERWVAQQEALDAELAQYGEAAIAALAPAASAMVLDVGCGCGWTSLALARRVPQGAVTGVDISAPMLARARERGAAIGNLTFELGDAQTYPFAPASFDAVFSRFGVMFFGDPTAAFANLRRALRPGGKLAFICWQAAQRNPWMMLPLMAALPHVTFTPPVPNAPGPFAFADRDRVAGILRDAGFAGIEIVPFEPEMTIAGDLDEATEFLLQLGPLAAALREKPEVVPVVRVAVREAMAAHHRDGAVRTPSATWIATARRPDVTA